MSKVTFLRQGIVKLNALSTTRISEHGAQYELFGIFAVINYTIPYFMWSPTTNINFSLPIFMRLIASFMCFVLIIKESFKESYKFFLPLYWHVTLLYCLPFLTTVMLFDSHGNIYGLLNFILAIHLLAVLVDWLSFALISVIGVLFGYLFFIALEGKELFSLSFDTLYWASHMCFFTVLISILFSRRNEKIAQEKLGAYKSVSASIAHELRTPLSSIYIAAQGVQTFLPNLLETYEIAQKHNLPIPSINQQKLNILQHFPANFISISRRSLSIIDIFLTQFTVMEKQKISLHPISALKAVTKSIDDYPFFPKELRSKIKIKIIKDFVFLGSETLIIHVFSNLIKNALQQITIAKKGTIKIWFSEDNEFNIIHFLDTATGIKDQELPKIFDVFYSSKDQGTGVGLAFCKKVLKIFDGEIVCLSKFGKYTEFKLYFPRCKKHKP